MVVREGQEKVIIPEALVKGDVVRVSAGDQIVVDGVMIGAGSLKMDESLLTGVPFGSEGHTNIVATVTAQGSLSIFISWTTCFLIMRAIWRANLFDRFLGLDRGNSTGH